MTGNSITPEGFERILKDLFTEDDDLGLDDAFAQVAVSRAYINTTQLDECRTELKKLESEGKKFQLGELLIYLGHLNTTAFKQVLVCMNREMRYCEWCYQIYETPESAEKVKEPPRCSKCGGPTHSAGGRPSTRELFPEEPSLPTPVPPSSKIHRMGKYLVRREIARGGMGVVYEAEDPELKRHVALKVLRNVGATSEYIRRLHREASIGAQLQHPNIVRVYEVSMAEDAPGHQNHFIAMEYIPGKTFADVLKETPRNLHRLLEILADVARGMEFAHRKKVIHRDLKPPNVLIEDTGRVVLTDFGLARAESVGTQMTRSWAVMGTPEYMAPEQVEGKTAQIDKRTDVYALGVMLYEILVGNPPFIADVPAELYQKILNEDPRRPTKVGTGISPDLELICLKAMHRDQDARYKNSGEFLRDLERYLKQEPIEARPSSFLYRIRKKLSKRKRLVSAAAGLFVLATGLGIFGVGFMRQKEAAWEESRKKMELERKELERKQKEARIQAIRDLRYRMQIALDAALAFRRAGNLVTMKEYVAHAETACREALDREPGFAEAHYRLGRMYRVVMENAKALEQQELALARDPDFAPALYERIVLTSWIYLDMVVDLRRKSLREQGARIFAEEQIGTKLVLPLPDRKELVAADPETSAIERQIKEDLLHLQDLLTLQPDVIREEEILLARGLYAWITDRLTDAEEFLTSAIVMNPLLEGGYEALSQLEFNRQAYPESIRWRTEGLVSDRGFIPHLEGRGLARFFWAIAEKNKGGAPISHFRISLADFENATRLDPERGRAWLNRALVNMHWGMDLLTRGLDPKERFEKGLKDLEEASRRSPDLVQIGLARGNILVHMGLYVQQKGGDPEPIYKDALDGLDKVVERSPDHYHAWANRAMVLQHRAMYLAKQGKDAEDLFRRAVADFDETLKRNPSLIQFWSERGWTCFGWANFLSFRGGNPDPLYERAVADLNRAIQMNPKLASSWVRQASVTARRFFLQIQRGENAQALFDLAIIQFNQALTLAPKNAQCWADMVGEWSKYLLTRGRKSPGGVYLQSAINDYTEALRLLPGIDLTLLKKVRLRLTQASLQAATGENAAPALASALEDATLLVERNSGWFQGWSIRGRTHELIGSLEFKGGKDPTSSFGRAVDDYARALEMNPEHFTTLINRGNVYVESAKFLLQQGKDPREVLRKAILDYNHAGKSNVTKNTLWLGRGVAHLLLGNAKKKVRENPEPDYEKAIRDLDEAIRLSPGHSQYLVARGNGCFSWAMWRYDEGKDARPQMRAARESLEMAIELNPSLEHQTRAVLRFIDDYQEKFPDK